MASLLGHHKEGFRYSLFVFPYPATIDDTITLLNGKGMSDILVKF